MSKARDLADSANSPGGGSSTDTTSRRLQYDATDGAYFEERVYKIPNLYSSWTTIATITMNWGTQASTYTTGMVRAHLAGLTNSVGVGAREGHWNFNINAGTITVGNMSVDTTGSGPPEFQLAVSGSTVLCQVRGSGGGGSINGLVHLGFYMPAQSALTTYTIT